MNLRKIISHLLFIQFIFYLIHIVYFLPFELFLRLVRIRLQSHPLIDIENNVYLNYLEANNKY